MKSRPASSATDAAPGTAPEPDIAALLADLDVSIADFDQRMASYQAEERRQQARGVATSLRAPNKAASAAFPSVPQDALRATADTGRDSRPAPAGGASASDLLAELRQAAAAHDSDSRRSQDDGLAQRQRFHRALRQAFDYFHELAQHLDVLRPTMPEIYVLGRDARYANVVWRHGDASFRTGGQSEHGLIETVVFRAVLAADSPLRLACRNDKAKDVRHELSLLNVRIADELTDTQPDTTVFCVSNEIRLQIHIAGEAETGRLLLHARNLGGFNLAAYAIAPEALDRQLLDTLGLMVLGRQRAAPTSLEQIPFSHGLQR